MATEYWTDIQPGVGFELRFRTDNREYFRFVEEAARACIDGLVPDGVRLKTKQATSEKTSDKIETNIYDSEEIHHNCTVQILHNSVTGEHSVGWWKEDEQPKEV